MRIAIILLGLGLAACGRDPVSEAPARGSGSAPRPPDPDERCDPAAKRVCVGNDVVACEPNGVLGRGLRACHDGCRNGACIPSCSADGVKLIYVVDEGSNLLSFDPRKLPGDPFHFIGKLACGRATGSPFSMSIDRAGVAWVVYGDGELYKVSIADARCERSGYVGRSSGFRTFGMGFVTDEPGGKTEKLFGAANDGSHALFSIDTEQATPAPHQIGTLGTNLRHPELTGTSEAKLFGFYPGDDEVSFVQEIDRKTAAAIGPRWPLGTTGLGFISSYAFAQWGGMFYIFVTAGDSTVRTINRTTGEYKTVLEHLPYRITGAGVSTCAPEFDRAGSASGTP